MVNNSATKKILITIPWFTPAFRAGGPVQSVLNLVGNGIDHSFFQVVSSDADVDGELLEVEKKDQWVSFNSQTDVMYLSKEGRLKKMKKLMQQNQADVIFITGIYSWVYTLIPILFSEAPRIILSVRGMLHPPALAQKRFKKKIYLAFLKPLLKWKKVEFHATDAAEEKHIRAIVGHAAKIWVVPNIPRLIENKQALKSPGKLKLLTVALIGPMKNHLEVLKSLKDCRYDVEYALCGPIYWPEYWNECQQVIQSLPANIKVIYHGAVPPDQLPAYYQQCHVFICPSQSENFGHALFEAFSAGKPVITSHHTPWNNLEAQQIGMNINPESTEISAALDFFHAMPADTYYSWCENAAAFARNTLRQDGTQMKYAHMFSA